MSARTKAKSKYDTRTTKPASHASPAVGTTAVGGNGVSPNPTLLQAARLIQKGDYAKAADLLAAAGRAPRVRDTLGVCLMRLGNIERAVDVYRSFVLIPGTVVERSEISNEAKRNFATALLMQGSASGALSVLSEIHDPNNPAAVRLTAAIKRWEKTLSWIRWIDWKLNGIEPGGCKIPLDFEPGELASEFQTQLPSEPDKSGKGSLELAA